MKYRIVHALQKYLFNPPIKLLFALGLARRDVRFLKRPVARRESRAAR